MSPPTNQHTSFFTGCMPFLSPNQHQCQSTEGKRDFSNDFFENFSRNDKFYRLPTDTAREMTAPGRVAAANEADCSVRVGELETRPTRSAGVEDAALDEIIHRLTSRVASVRQQWTPVTDSCAQSRSSFTRRLQLRFDFDSTAVRLLIRGH